jgi:beta-lactam-binding protein with PASTA domain
VSPEPPKRRRRIVDYAPALPKKKKTGEHAYALIASLAILAVVVAVVLTIAYRILLPSGNPVPLPDFSNLPYETAQRLADSAHVGLRVVAHHSDERMAKGYIIGQFPAAGEHVREGRVVDVIVSDGPMVATVPDLTDMSVRDAQVALGNARLELGSVTVEKSQKVPQGRVMRQQPDAGSQVATTSKVDITVAKGKPVAYVPNFIGLSLTFSQSAAKQANVSLGPPMLMPITKGAKPKGTVVAQDPLPGQPLLSTDKVILQVSGGPPATPTPFPTVPPTETPQSATAAPESPTPASGAASTPTAAPVARSLRIAVQLPASKTPKRERVALVDATGSRDLYDQMTAGGFTLSFDVTVTGAGTVQTYVDGALTTSTSL